MYNGGDDAFRGRSTSPKTARGRSPSRPPNQELSEDDLSPEELYSKVAREQVAGFLTFTNGKLPKRSPYLAGTKMGRGADFAQDFRLFVETGGISKWKSSVVMSIRLNELRDVDSVTGSGSFYVGFFLDTAFWVPEFDFEHYASADTVGKFTKYEPMLEFPEVDVDNGLLKWGMRTAEFSKDVGRSRHHEVQIGQNFETLLIDEKMAKKSSLLDMSNLSAITMDQAEKVKTVKKLSVVDAHSHWPRLWRVCLSDTEISEMSKMDAHSRRIVEPTNEHPTRCNARLTALFNKLDAERAANLSHPLEGIAFVTYEITCTHRCEFALQEFPFDMHNLRITVRIKDRDAMSRNIIPIAHDKSFFMSSRISELSEFHLSQHLDWEVTKEAVILGGSQRLNASVIVRRKPKYYIRNYILVVFMLSTSSFASFLSRPDDYETRAVVIFTILLSVVAFKYNAGDEIPRVPYSTLFEAYVILNFYALLGIGFITFGFAMVCGMGGTESGNNDKVQRDVFCSRNPGRLYGVNFIWAYDPVYETITGLVVFALWLGWNAWYWNGIMTRFHESVLAVNESGLKWLRFKYVEGEQGRFPVERYVLRAKDAEEEAAAASAVAATASSGGGASSLTSPVSNGTQKSAHEQSHTPPSRLYSASSFNSISSTSSSSTMNTNVTLEEKGGASTEQLDEAMTSPALKNLKIDENTGNLRAGSEGSVTPNTPKKDSAVVQSSADTSLDLESLVDHHVDTTL